MADNNKTQADECKQRGNELYKAKQFEQAKAEYTKAWELHKDVTYLTNLAAVLFEEEKYDECIAECEKAVEESHNSSQDFKIVAKALGRIASAYVKKEDYDNAIKYYNKSLTEHRNADTLQKLKETEKKREEAVKKAYYNPEISVQAREEGNKLYKTGDFAASVERYTEAVKRNPEEPRNYTNRASSYIKLMALSEALKDAEMAIKVDPTFVKGYVRKCGVYVAMKEFDKALSAIEEARLKDVEKANARELSELEQKAYKGTMEQRATETDEQRLERAMKDPEVQQIMTDPVMQSILQQAKNDPNALRAHMQNADVRNKIQKLVQVGIVRLG